METNILLESYLWTLIDFDNFAWFQCVDLARKFAFDIHNPIWTFSGSAYNWWDTWSPFSNTEWIREENTPDWIPKPWSIIFFDKTPKNPYWHVAIVESGDLNNITIIEQNAGKWLGTWTTWDRVKRATVWYTQKQNSKFWLWKCLGWYYL